MKILVIPDVHLKPYIFKEASYLMSEGTVDKAVCLMDIADDFGQDKNITLYEETYDAAIEFARRYPDTLWCYGNHDLSYVWHKRETGYSDLASYTVIKKILELKSETHDINQIGYVHRIDNVLFSHGGLLSYFVEEYVSEAKYDDIDYVIDKINSLGVNEMWNDASPLWLRPQYSKMRMYKQGEFLQVVGHTPVKKITRAGDIISCDVFSTYADGSPIGSREYMIVDTVEKRYCVVGLGVNIKEKGQM